MKKLFLLGTVMCCLGMMVACGDKETACEVGYINTYPAENTTLIQLNNDFPPICYSGYGTLYFGEGWDLPMTESDKVGFTDVGEVESLCDIQKIPNVNFFRTSITLKKHHGVIVLTITEEGKALYHRIYVEDLIRDGDSELIIDSDNGFSYSNPTKAVLKMQTGWKYE